MDQRFVLSTLWIYLRPLWSASFLRVQEGSIYIYIYWSIQSGRVNSLWGIKEAREEKPMPVTHRNSLKPNNCQLNRSKETCLTTEPTLVWGFSGTLLQCQEHLCFSTKKLTHPVFWVWFSISTFHILQFKWDVLTWRLVDWQVTHSLEGKTLHGQGRGNRNQV